MFIFLKLSNFEPSRSYVEETTSMLQRTYRYNRFRIIIALLRLKMLQTSTYYSFDISEPLLFFYYNDSNNYQH